MDNCFLIRDLVFSIFDLLKVDSLYGIRSFSIVCKEVYNSSHNSDFKKFVEACHSQRIQLAAEFGDITLFNMHYHKHFDIGIQSLANRAASNGRAHMVKYLMECPKLKYCELSIEDCQMEAIKSKQWNCYKELAGNKHNLSCLAKCIRLNKIDFVVELLTSNPDKDALKQCLITACVCENYSAIDKLVLLVGEYTFEECLVSCAYNNNLSCLVYLRSKYPKSFPWQEVCARIALREGYKEMLEYCLTEGYKDNPVKVTPRSVNQKAQGKQSETEIEEY